MPDSLDSYANLEELNQKFASFFERRNEEKEPHVLEIIKRNNRETIMVNLLDFFIQDKYHDIGDKLYQKLLDCINNKSEQFDYGKLVSVKTEQSISRLIRDQKKRIDMVIETEHAIIIIEAKVNHVLNNNLVIYADYAKKLAKEKKKDHYKKIILSKWPSNSLERFKESKEQKKAQIEESKNWIEISWEDVLNDSLSPSDEPYKSLYNSMVKSMKGDEYLIENEIEEAKENFEQIAKTFEFAKTVFKFQDEKAKQLLIELEKLEFPKNSEPKIWKYSEPFEKGAFVPRVVIEKKGEYVIDICVDIRGYQFVILKRDNDVHEEDINDLVEQLGYVVKEFDDPTEKESKRLIIHNKKKKEKSEFLFTNDDAQTKIADDDYSGIAEFAKQLYEKINQKS